MDPRELFEAELARRGLRHAADVRSGRCVVWVRGAKLAVSLDNLARQLTGDEGDAERVAWFTDQVIAAAGPAALTADGLYWCLEPNDYRDRPDYRAAVSPGLDHVLVHADPVAALIRWITPRALSELGLSADEASERAWSNLGAAARRAPQVTTGPVGGITLLSFAAAIPSNASLLLAPSLREVVSGVAGWPVLAVAPERDVVYLWNAAHRDLASRLGSMVVRIHTSAAYPLSTELFEISDSIRAIGSYRLTTAVPKGANPACDDSGGGRRRGHRHLPTMPQPPMMHFCPNQNREGRLTPAPNRMIGAAIRSTEPQSADAPNRQGVCGERPIGHRRELRREDDR